MPRCDWCGDDPLYVQYHDAEWGVPLHDEQRMFEFIVLEGAQAGLSWITVLRKREAYREALCGFDVQRVAALTDVDIERLLTNPGIIRNRMKLNSARRNARATLDLYDGGLSLVSHLWSFVDGEPLQNHWSSMSEVPAETTLSQTISRDLKQRGFNFVGPTIVYALMQATGLVNDHLIDCPRHAQCAALPGPGKPS
jgi:DNA-3-methyladenine glycosylase I